MADPGRTRSASHLFSLERLADGVYAAIGRESPCAVSNAGIVDLGGRTLVFDTFTSPRAGQDLLRTAIEVTGRRPDWVVISHGHSDHWLGNQAFPEATILSSAASRRGMPKMADYVRSYRDDPSRLAAEIETERAKLAKEKDAARQVSLSWSIGRLQCLAESLPTLELRLPDLVFQRGVRLSGSRRTAYLVARGHGHSRGDVELQLPDEGILFAGDLAFFQTQPFMGSCDPARWSAWLDWAVASDFQTIVPGHGPVGGKADLALEAEYVLALGRLVDRVIARGGTADDLLRERLPTPFDAWQRDEAGRFEMNARVLFAKRTGS